MYDRRSFEEKINGNKIVAQDHRVAILNSALPAWLLSRIAGSVIELDVRDDYLLVTELITNGQGIVVSVCRGR